MNNILNKRSTGFAQISNEMLNDNTLSLKAKGLYAYMFSKPQEWNFTIKSMSKHLKEGVEAIHTALRELRDAGWLEYNKHADGHGTYILNISKEPNPENPNEDEAKFGKPKLGFPERISNKDNINTPLPPKGEARSARKASRKEKLPRTKPVGFEYPSKFESLWSINRLGDKWSAYKAWFRIKDAYSYEHLKKVLTLEAGKSFGRRHTSTVFNGDLDIQVSAYGQNEYKIDWSNVV